MNQDKKTSSFLEAINKYEKKQSDAILQEVEEFKKREIEKATKEAALATITKYKLEQEAKAKAEAAKQELNLEQQFTGVAEDVPLEEVPNVAKQLVGDFSKETSLQSETVVQSEVKPKQEVKENINNVGGKSLENLHNSDNLTTFVDIIKDMGHKSSLKKIFMVKGWKWTGNPKKLEEILTRFEHFGLPIHFTENTIVAGPSVDPSIIDLQDAHYDDDAATPELEQMQADELSKMYRNLFENHPLVTAITNWDFADGAWLNAPSGLIRKDNSLKPSYNALYDLIHKEWHTNLNAKTDENGFVELVGLGETTLTISKETKNPYRSWSTYRDEWLIRYINNEEYEIASSAASTPP